MQSCVVSAGHRNVYVGVHMPYGRKHHHRHHHRHRHHKRKHQHGGNGLTIPSVDSIDHSPLSTGGAVDPIAPINPCDRVKFILGEEEPVMGGGCNSSSSNNMPACSSRQLFTEMDELCCYPDNRMEWKETARLVHIICFILSWFPGIPIYQVLCQLVILSYSGSLFTYFTSVL